MLAKQETQMTLKDIAELAHCSTATVSRVINNEKGVSEATRKYIQQIIDEYDFQPNKAAKGLAEQKTNTLLFVYENTPDKGTNPPVKSMHIVKACNDNDILHDYYVMTGNNLPQLISNTIYDYTNVPYNKIVYVKRGGDLLTENYVHMPIRPGYDNIIYMNIPIVGYGYTKSIEEILKN